MTEEALEKSNRPREKLRRLSNLGDFSLTSSL